MIGTQAENFTLKDQNGNSFNLYENLDKKVLLIFYPKDNSYICTKQLSDYQQNKHLFEENNIAPVGINIEDVKRHKSFCNDLDIGFPVLSDKDKKVSRRFHALNLFGVNKRKLIMIDEYGKIVFDRNSHSLSYLNVRKIIALLRDSKIL